MFTGKSRNTPKTLEDCTKAEQFSNELWFWSERIATWGRYLMIALCIIGIISAIAAGSETAEWLGESSSHGKTTMVDVFISAITALLPWGIYVVIEYIVCKMLSLMIGAAAAITQNTAVAANVALYTAAKDSENADK